MQVYSSEEREQDPNALPDIEIFEQEDGFYWWPCFPGCLPDGEPDGPFDSEEEALEDCRS